MIIQWIEGYPIVSDKPILYLLFTRVYPCFKVDEGLPEIGTRCCWMWRMWMPGAVSSWGSFLKKLSHTLRLLNSLLWKMVRWFMIIYDYLWWFMMIYDDLWWFGYDLAVKNEHGLQESSIPRLGLSQSRNLCLLTPFGWQSRADPQGQTTWQGVQNPLNSSLFRWVGTDFPFHGLWSSLII